MKIGMTPNAPDSVRKFKRAIVASAIATFLTACGGITESGGGNTTGTTPDIGAAIEEAVNTDTDQVGTDGGSNVDVTPDVDSPNVDSEGDVSGGGQTDVDIDTTTDTGTVDVPAIDLPDTLPDNALGLIQSHPDLGLFATAIQSSGLVDYLADPEQRVTVFALSSKAFESLSAIQRDALFNDPDRLRTLVRATTIPDTRISASAAGVVDEMQALSNSTLTFEREGEVISVVGTACCAVLPEAVEIIDTLMNDEAAIHVIDDFTNIDAIFFPPDPDSIMQRLLEDGDTTFTNRLGGTRWYKELGNSELDWTVFVPEMGGNYGELESHIVAREVNDPILLEAGTLTSVNERSHVIENAGGALTIDDIDISDLNALQVINGYVHRIVWPLGEYVSVLDRINEYEANGNNYYSGNQGSDQRHAFFAELIRATGETARYDDRENRISLVIPSYGLTAVELEQRFGEYSHPYSATTMYDTFANSRNDQSLSMVTDIFPDIETARTFLLSHTIKGYLTEELLKDSVGGYLATEAGTTLAVTEEIIDDPEGGDSRADLYLDGQLFRTSDSAANGTLLTSALALAATPEFSGWGDGDEIDPEIPSGYEGPVAEALSVNNRIFLEAFTNAFGAQKLDETADADPWTIFAPTEAVADIDVQDYLITGSALTAQELIDMGTATTFGGTTLTFGGTADAMTINGLAAVVVGDGLSSSTTYSVEGNL